jgi:hypothetical protein
MEIDRLPEIKMGWEVEPGLSNEWDLFWLMHEDKRMQCFEMFPNFRTGKIGYMIEYFDETPQDVLVGNQSSTTKEEK